MSFTPSEASALKLITDFESGSKFSEVKLKSTSRISGAFPLPFELVKSNPTTPFLLKRRTFDDTILNRNESLLKKRCFERRLSNDDSNDSINDSVVLGLFGFYLVVSIIWYGILICALCCYVGAFRSIFRRSFSQSDMKYILRTISS